MPHIIRFFSLILLLFLGYEPSVYSTHQLPEKKVLVDDEYDRYKKQGDDFFNQGDYLKAKRRYQNCREVPGFENDTYARKRITDCTTSLTLRRQGDEAWQRGKKIDAIQSFDQLLTLNTNDPYAREKLISYYNNEGQNSLKIKHYRDANSFFKEACKYTSDANKEDIRRQIAQVDSQRNADRRFKLQLAVGGAALAAGTCSFILWDNYRSRKNELIQFGQTVDPQNTGLISKSSDYALYEKYYKDAAAAQREKNLFNACMGLATVATLAELYLFVHKPRLPAQKLICLPSSQTMGLAIRYSF